MGRRKVEDFLQQGAPFDVGKLYQRVILQAQKIKNVIVDVCLFASEILHQIKTRMSALIYSDKLAIDDGAFWKFLQSFDDQGNL